MPERLLIVTGDTQVTALAYGKKTNHTSNCRPCGNCYRGAGASQCKGTRSAGLIVAPCSPGSFMSYTQARARGRPA